MIKFISKNPSKDSIFPVVPIEECLEWCENNDIIGIDTETIGNCWSGYIYTLQVGNADVQYVIDSTSYSPLLFKKYFEDPNKLYIGQNIKYDLKFFLNLGIKIPKIYDTFLVECILTTGLKNRRLRLDYIVEKYCNNTLNKEVRGRINYAGLTDEVIEYAARDVEFLEDIMNKQLKEVEKWDLKNLVDLENNVCKVFSEIEYYGMKLDVDKWIYQYSDKESQADKFENILNDYILNNPDKFGKYIDNQLDLFDSTVKTSINWASPKQVMEIMNFAGVKVDSVNEGVIEKYRDKVEIVDLYLNYKENQTSISKFGRDYLKWVNKDTGRVPSTYWQILATGRVSSGMKDEFPNMQQLPATNQIRNCFIAEEGYSFVDCDYSAMELVISGCVSGEESWIEAFENGYDLHSVVAEAVYKDKWINGADEDCQYYINKQKCNCKFHKEMRNKIKTLNYLSLYGGGPQKLSQSINISLNEAKEVISNYFKGLPKLTEFLDKLKSYGKAYGYIRTKKPYQRVRFFEPHENDFAKLGTIERQSGNTFVQG